MIGKIMPKKIKFVWENHRVKNVHIPPQSAKNSIPEWFKKIPADNFENNRFGRDTGTVKKCLPFLDAMTMGYTYNLPFDLSVSTVDGKKFLQWQVSGEESFVISEEPYRIDGLKPPLGFTKEVFRLGPFGPLETPAGYSTIFMHPMNRYDLPFLVLSGVVDTDKLHQSSTVALYLKDDFTGIIAKGTPLVQILPFKRDNWSSELVDPYSDSLKEKLLYDIRAIINRTYQTQYWSKKTYN